MKKIFQVMFCVVSVAIGLCSYQHAIAFVAVVLEEECQCPEGSMPSNDWDLRSFDVTDLTHEGETESEWTDTIDMEIVIDVPTTQKGSMEVFVYDHVTDNYKTLGTWQPPYEGQGSNQYIRWYGSNKFNPASPFVSHCDLGDWYYYVFFFLQDDQQNDEVVCYRAYKFYHSEISPVIFEFDPCSGGDHDLMCPCGGGGC